MNFRCVAVLAVVAIFSARPLLAQVPPPQPGPQPFASITLDFPTFMSLRYEAEALSMPGEARDRLRKLFNDLETSAQQQRAVAEQAQRRALEEDAKAKAKAAEEDAKAKAKAAEGGQ